VKNTTVRSASYDGMVETFRSDGTKAKAVGASGRAAQECILVCSGTTNALLMCHAATPSSPYRNPSSWD